MGCLVKRKRVYQDIEKYINLFRKAKMEDRENIACFPVVVQMYVQVHF